VVTFREVPRGFTRNRLLISVGTAIVLIVGIVRLPASPVRRRVYGRQTPCPLNLLWIVEGERAIDNWQAKLCGCKPPTSGAEHKELIEIRLVHPNPYAGSDVNAGAIHVLGSKWRLKRGTIQLVEE
jgi:hypothetical protein